MGERRKRRGQMVRGEGKGEEASVEEKDEGKRGGEGRRRKRGKGRTEVKGGDTSWKC